LQKKRESGDCVCKRERVYGKTLKPQKWMSKETLDKWGFYSHAMAEDPYQFVSGNSSLGRSIKDPRIDEFAVS
jgi:hypothetical protein